MNYLGSEYNLGVEELRIENLRMRSQMMRRRRQHGHILFIQIMIAYSWRFQDARRLVHGRFLLLSSYPQ